MKITKLIISISICSIFLTTSCTKYNDIELDKQIRLSLGGVFFGYTGVPDTFWHIQDDYWLHNFNKNNYPKIKSIIFSALIFSTDTSNYCIAELYNLTDKVSIKNSEIRSNQIWIAWDTTNYMSVTDLNYIESNNIINSLPDKTIDLVVRIRSSKPDTIKNHINSCIMGTHYLFLNR